MTERLYRAACPNCGATVEFRSAASAMAVCSYCGSTLLREGEALRRIGQVAELFDDHSPIRIGATGHVPQALAGLLQQPDQAVFTVIGRLQYRYSDGLWSEWTLLLDDGQQLWLSEDNGRYVLGRDAGVLAEAPPRAQLTDGVLQAGRPIEIQGRRFEITSIVPALLNSAAGELSEAGARIVQPRATQPEREQWLLDARAADGTIATLDYDDPRAVRLSLGWPVALADLKMTGLALELAAQVGARGFECPSCGAPVKVELTGTRSITCPSCAAVIDLSQGQGADLQYFRQQRRIEAPIPLGSRGTLFDTQWQVVGFARRSGRDDDGYSFSWEELLLFEAMQGFAFLVLASDGSSFVRTVQDSPQWDGRRGARYDGRSFRAESAYVATVDYVEGEFYWQVRAGQQTSNIDFLSGDRVLSREAEQLDSGSEVVWSYGQRISASALAQAFGLKSIPPPSMRPAVGIDGRGNALGPASAMAAAGAAGAAAAGAGGAGAGAASGIGAASGAGAASGIGGSPVSGSGAIVVIIVIVLVILVLAFMFASPGGGSGGYRGGYSGGGFSGSHK